MSSHCSTRVTRRELDPVEAEQVRGLLEVVDDVVDLGGQQVDVLTIERRQVLGVEQRDQIAGDRVSLGLGGLHLLLRHARVRVLLEAAIDEPGYLERVHARLREEGVELARPRGQGEAHGGAR